MSEPVIEAAGLCKSFDAGKVRAVDQLTLRIARGEMAAITGPSGCGKSTFLHLVAALTTPSAGRLTVEGVDLAKLRQPARYRRERVGLVFQLHNLLPHLTAVQNVELPMIGTAVPRSARRDRARKLLADVELADQSDRKPTELSGGERQRVAIARALVNDPAILLADEPTGSLDERSVQHTLALMAQLRVDRPDLTIVLVTHDDHVAKACDRILRMGEGHLVSAGAGSAEVD